MQEPIFRTFVLTEIFLNNTLFETQEHQYRFKLKHTISVTGSVNAFKGT
jgi:hypothetical protein